MKKILLFAIALLVMVGRDAVAQEKKLADYYAGIIPGTPAKLQLPHGKKEQIYAAPLAETGSYINSSTPVKAILILSNDEALYEKFRKAGAKDSVLVAGGPRLDPFQSWNKKQLKDAAKLLGLSSLEGLREYIFVMLTYSDTFAPGTDPRTVLSVGAESSKNKNLKGLF